MLDDALWSQSRKIHRREVSPERQFAEMDGFRACLAEAKTYFADAMAARRG